MVDALAVLGLLVLIEGASRLSSQRWFRLTVGPITLGAYAIGRVSAHLVGIPAPWSLLLLPPSLFAGCYGAMRLTDTRLLRAACKGRVAEVKRLLETGADIERPDGLRRTPLFLAVAKGHSEIAEVLLAAGASIRTHASPTPSLLHVAVSQNADSRLIRLLSEHGVDPNAPDNMGQTPLGISLTRRRPEAVRALLECGADPGIVLAKGRLPLHLACSKEMPELIPEMVRHGADPEARDVRGRTPLDQAFRMHDPAPALALIRAGANVRKPLQNGYTPLTESRRHGWRAVTELISAKLEE